MSVNVLWGVLIFHVNDLLSLNLKNAFLLWIIIMTGCIQLAENFSVCLWMSKGRNTLYWLNDS